LPALEMNEMLADRSLANGYPVLWPLHPAILLLASKYAVNYYNS